MGIPPDIVYGNDCLACYPPGETPKFIYITAADITKCAWAAALELYPPNDLFKLTQSNGCDWAYIDDTYQVIYNGVAPDAGLVMKSGILIWLKYLVQFNCPTVFGNTSVCFPNFNIGEGGFARLGFVS